MAEESHWSDEVCREIKKREIASVCTIPDGGLNRLLNLNQGGQGMRLITLVTEEKGMGIVTGQWPAAAFDDRDGVLRRRKLYQRARAARRDRAPCLCW